MRPIIVSLTLAVLILGLLSLNPMLHAQKAGTYTDPKEAGPDFLVQGEYEGAIGKDKLGAQVIAKGNGKFIGRFLPGGLPGTGWDGKTKIKLEAQSDADQTVVKGTWTGVIKDGTLTGKTDGGKEFTLKRVERKSKTQGAKPPAGAIVLFDGSNADQWQNGQLVEGKLLKMGTRSKRSFGNMKLHIEFRCPFRPKSGGQGRGNSGVYVNGKEIQVLDSFGLDLNKGDGGALYGFKIPDVNMSFPPLSWQTYDVEYRLARKDGGKQIPATMTVRHNGILIHDKVELKGGRSSPGTINLQNHGNPVYFRNIWVQEEK